MPRLANQILLLTCAIVCGSLNAAESREPAARASGKTTATVELFNPVAFLTQVIASMSGAEVPFVPPVRMSFTVPGTSTSASTGESLAIHFAPDGEQRTVALVLAESQVRVKLTQGWLLRCELASRDEANSDAELQVDVGVQFKFR